MANDSNGPQSHAEAVKQAQLNQQYGGNADTRNWSYDARVTYAKNGGK